MYKTKSLDDFRKNIHNSSKIDKKLNNKSYKKNKEAKNAINDK